MGVAGSQSRGEGALQAARVKRETRRGAEECDVGACGRGEWSGVEGGASCSNSCMRFRGSLGLGLQYTDVRWLTRGKKGGETTHGRGFAEDSHDIL